MAWGTKGRVHDQELESVCVWAGILLLASEWIDSHPHSHPSPITSPEGKLGLWTDWEVRLPFKDHPKVWECGLGMLYLCLALMWISGELFFFFKEDNFKTRTSLYLHSWRAFPLPFAAVLTVLCGIWPCPSHQEPKAHGLLRMPQQRSTSQSFPCGRKLIYQARCVKTVPLGKRAVGLLWSNLPKGAPQDMSRRDFSTERSWDNADPL